MTFTHPIRAAISALAAIALLGIAGCNRHHDVTTAATRRALGAG